MSTDTPVPPTKPGWFASEGWRWLIVTILIPAVGFGWDRLQERQLKREKELDRERGAQQQRFEDRRNQSELVIKLLPALSSDPGSSQRSVALAVLSDLAQRGAGGDSLFAAVNLAVQESDRRVRSGQASDSERATLTHIAAARDEGLRVDPQAARAEPAPPATEQPRTKDAAPRAFAIATPRLYVQVFDDSQLAAADKLRNEYANERRWLTPGVEKGTIATPDGKPLPGNKVIRVDYFNNADEKRANTVVDWLRSNGHPDARAQLSALKAPPGQIEVVFPNEG